MQLLFEDDNTHNNNITTSTNALTLKVESAEFFRDKVTCDKSKRLAHQPSINPRGTIPNHPSWNHRLKINLPNPISPSVTLNIL